MINNCDNNPCRYIPTYMNNKFHDPAGLSVFRTGGFILARLYLNFCTIYDHIIYRVCLLLYNHRR